MSPPLVSSPSPFSVGLMPAERDAKAGTRARVIVRGVRRAAFAPVSASSLPTKRKPPRAGYASPDEDAYEEVLASSSASPVARVRRRESAAPHPRATRVAARSSISAIFAPPRRIDRHGTAVHATDAASCVFLHAELSTTRAKIESGCEGSVAPRAVKPRSTAVGEV